MFDFIKNRYSGKHFKPASGAVIRHILQELEKAELIKKVKVQDGHTLNFQAFLLPLL